MLALHSMLLERNDQIANSVQSLPVLLRGGVKYAHF